MVFYLCVTVKVQNLEPQEGYMDWIEKLTGFSPDGGGGGFELQILVIVGLAVAAAVVIARKLRAS